MGAPRNTRHPPCLQGAQSKKTPVRAMPARECVVIWGIRGLTTLYQAFAVVSVSVALAVEAAVAVTTRL